MLDDAVCGAYSIMSDYWMGGLAAFYEIIDPCMTTAVLDGASSCGGGVFLLFFFSVSTCVLSLSVAPVTTGSFTRF